MSETDSVFGEEEDGDEEEEDVSVLSSLENYQLCLKYQQVLHQQVNTQHSESALVVSKHDSLKVCSETAEYKTKSQFYFPFFNGAHSFSRNYEAERLIFSAAERR